MSEEEIQKKNDENAKYIRKYDRGAPFLHDKISLKNGKYAFIFYNQGRKYAEIIGEDLKTERYIFASLENDYTFNIYFFKEIHKQGVLFKNWDRKISEPELKHLSFCYAKEDELHSVSSLFYLDACKGSEKFKNFGFDIDFLSLRDSIEKFEEILAKLYPIVKINPAYKDYFYSAIKETFDTEVGGAANIAAVKREKNISIINNGELFEKGVVFEKIKRNISDKNDDDLSPYIFYRRLEFIKTIAFISIENGMWEKYAVKHSALTETQIKNRNEKLLKQLKEKFAKDKIIYTMLSRYNGKNEDKTFVIYNVPLEYIQDIAKKALQESFVLLFTYYNGSFDFSHYVEKGGIAEYFQYMKSRYKDHNGRLSDLAEYKAEYIEVGTVTEIKCVLDFNEGVCKKLKSFGLNLDLSVFEGILQEFCERIKVLYPQVEKDGINKRYLSNKIYDSIYKKKIEDMRIINSGKLFCT